MQFCNCVGWISSLLFLTVIFPSSEGLIIRLQSEEPLQILFSNRQSLVKLDVEPSVKESVVIDGLSNAVAVDYDFEKKIAVWTDVRIGTKGIFSVNIDAGDSRKVVATSGVITPDGLAVDWIYGNIYWTDTGVNSLSVATLDGEFRKTLFASGLDEPRAIVVNPLEGWMFWTDWGSNPKIERSGMDGSHRSTIVSRNTSRIAIPNGLAIDYDTRRIFWADVTDHCLRSSDYDGSAVKEILISSSKLGHPFAVDVFQDWLYWTDWRSHKISKTQKLSAKSVADVTAKTHLFPMGLRVYNSKKQPKGKNYCVEGNAKCQYLCLPAPIGIQVTSNFTCACPDGKNCSSADAVTRVSTPSPVHFSYAERRKSETESPTVSSSTAETSQAESSRAKLQSDAVNDILSQVHENSLYYGRIVGVNFALLALLTIVISLIGFYVYKQSFRRDDNSFNFSNPVFQKQTGDSCKSDSGLPSEQNLNPCV